jgi:hypothetical protein
MRRPHGRKARNKGQKPPHFVILTERWAPFPADGLDHLKKRQPLSFDANDRAAPKPVAMARLFQRLDLVSAISKAPLARARRLAFYLARNREGPILAPDPRRRPPSYWNTDARATFDALAHNIITRSKARPPPMAPVRNCWPTITRLPQW